MKIAHVSDIHLASGYFVQKWGENLIDIINSSQPDLLILTGDLTDNGYINEFEMARSFIDRMEVPNKLIVPGNHDARNLGYEIFEDMIGPRFPCFQNHEVCVVGLDSTEPDLDDGHVGRENYDRIRDNLSPNKVRIIALHHHLIPIPGTGRERQIPTDAGDLLGLCHDLKVNFVLSGHKHLPWRWQLEDMHFITAGTSTTRRLKGRSYPSMGMLDLGDQAAYSEINVDDRRGREVLRVNNSNINR